MPIKNDREYRKAMPFIASDDYIVEGYASTFKPYVMYSYNGVDYYETIDKKAFDNADMSDVIFQYDHSGKVYARQSNGTLELTVDDTGLKVRANLSKTSASKEMYEEIKAELVNQMSFAFTVEEDSYNNETHTRCITKIKKVYDVSAVSIPANPDTSISARSYFEGVIEAEKREALEREKQKQRIRILAEIERTN